MDEPLLPEEVAPDVAMQLRSERAAGAPTQVHMLPGTGVITDEVAPHITRTEAQKAYAERGSRKITPEKEDQIIRILESGGTFSLAAKAVDVSLGGLQYYVKTREDFAARVKAARDFVDDAVEAALFNVAIGATKNEGKGQIVAMIFWLKNRRPRDWRESSNFGMGIPAEEGVVSQFILPGGAILPTAASGVPVASLDKPIKR